MVKNLGKIPQPIYLNQARCQWPYHNGAAWGTTHTSRLSRAYVVVNSKVKMQQRVELVNRSDIISDRESGHTVKWVNTIKQSVQQWKCFNDNTPKQSVLSKLTYRPSQVLQR